MIGLKIMIYLYYLIDFIFYSFLQLGEQGTGSPDGKWFIDAYNTGALQAFCRFYPNSPQELSSLYIYTSGI